MNTTKGDTSPQTFYWQGFQSLRFNPPKKIHINLRIPVNHEELIHILETNHNWQMRKMQISFLEHG